MRIEIDRESVCMADDMNDHRKLLDVDDDITYEMLFSILKDMKFFPSVFGNNVVWVLTANGYDCIFSYFTLTDKLSQGLSDKMLKNICTNSNNYNFLFKYYNSPKKWKEAIYKMYNNDEYAMWRDGWSEELGYCDILDEKSL